jgi:hypothetical protein
MQQIHELGLGLGLDLISVALLVLSLSILRCVFLSYLIFLSLLSVSQFRICSFLLPFCLTLLLA